MSDPFAIEGPAVISFSGGRTSGLMLRRCLDAGLMPHVFVVFADTGLEREETYDFVRECSSRWGVEIHWVARDKGEYATPFDKLIVDRGFLPNPVMRFCTTELKIRPMKAFMMARGYEHWTNVVGLRADEPSRVSRMRATNAAGKDRWDTAMPLAEAGVTVGDVAAFWKGQRFDLHLESHESNCSLCMLKSRAKKERIIRDHPELADWWIAKEKLIGARFRATGPSYQEMADYQRRQLTMFQEPAACATEEIDDLGDCICSD